MPTTKAGITSYLTSTAYGVGRVKAAAIYDELGEDCLDLIQKEGPGCLLRVKGVTPEMAQEIHTKLMANTVLAELSALICREGVTPNLAHKIYNQYGADSVRVVKENPYMLSDDIHGVGFKIADKVAYSVGTLPNDAHRVEAAIDFVLKEAGNDGHCYLRPRDIVGKVLSNAVCGKASGIDVDDIRIANLKLIDSGRCVREGDCIYPVRMYQAEVSLAQRMRVLNGQMKYGLPELEDKLREWEVANTVELATEQRGAVMMSVTCPLSIVTGGPGTGKTTTTNAIIAMYREYNPDKPVYLAAPTGRAAKRITETTGIEAFTLHRLLRYNPGYGGFTHNELNPLEPGLLVVDEASMMDVELADSLFKAVTNEMQVVLVGDVDQLPSVGPGSVLRDSIMSGVIPVTFLEYNYRQAQGSKIAYYAHQIRHGLEIPLYEQFDDYWCRLVEDDCEDAGEMAARYVLDEVRRAVGEGYGIMDFQVLAPMRRGSAGVNNLNDLIRDLVNPETAENKTKSWYRVRDKVMVIRNDYKKMVFNGDIGQVVAAGVDTDAEGDETEGLYISFDGTEVFFPYNDLNILTLAYASTVHKSQGSEFPLVIMVCVKQHYVMLQKNLLYTGVTRARNKLVLVCQEYAVKKAAGNDLITERFSRLKEKLVEG